MAKPSVDGLEHRMSGHLDVAHVNTDSPEGERLASQFGESGLPTYIVLNTDGRVLYRQTGGRPDGDEIARRIEAAR